MTIDVRCLEASSTLRRRDTRPSKDPSRPKFPSHASLELHLAPPAEALGHGIPPENIQNASKTQRIHEEITKKRPNVTLNPSLHRAIPRLGLGRPRLLHLLGPLHNLPHHAGGVVLLAAAASPSIERQSSYRNGWKSDDGDRKRHKKQLKSYQN